MSVVLRTVLILLVLAASGCEAPPPERQETEGRREAVGRQETGGAFPLPNFIYVMADDLGMGDVSTYQDWTGNSDEDQLLTPNIDKLARMGVRFTDAHSSSTVCTPTRYAFLTGRYSWRTRLKHKVLFGPWAPPLIDRERVTLPEMLRSAGYDTGMSGKWHLGLLYSTTDGRLARSWEEADLRKDLLDGPVDHGFNYAFFTARSHKSSAVAGWIENRTAINATRAGPHSVAGYDMSLTGKMNFEHAKKFLDAHFAGPQRESPFFLYYPTNSNHIPYVPSVAVNGVPVQGQSRFASGEHAGLRGDFIYENDVAVGEFLRYLGAQDDPRRPGHKLLENTLFIFTSDNGSETGEASSVGPLRGMKASIYEGGHRVPLIVSWPVGGVGDGNPETPGLTSGRLIGLHDVYATLAEITEQPLPPPEHGPEDSESFLSTLRSTSTDRSTRSPAVFHDDYTLGPALALRDGPWKLIVGSDLVWRGRLAPIALFNLDENLAEEESRNLLRDPSQSARVQDLSAKLMRIYSQGTTS